MPLGSRQFSRRKFEKTTRIPGHYSRHVCRSHLARRRETCDGVRHPGRLIALASERDRSQIGRVRLRKNTIVRNKAQQSVVGPLSECHDSAEGDVPSRLQCGFSEIVRTSVAMQHSDHSRLPCLRQHCTRVRFGVSRVDNDRQSSLAREPELLGKRAPLFYAR